MREDYRFYLPVQLSGGSVSPFWHHFLLDAVNNRRPLRFDVFGRPTWQFWLDEDFS